MHLLLGLLFAFNVVNLPYLRYKNSDFISLKTASKILQIDTEITDSSISLSFGTEYVRINPQDLTYTGKTKGILRTIRKDSENVFIDAEDLVYISGVLVGKHYYWDSQKHRIIVSSYTPSIKSFEVDGNTIKLIHNIDLEPTISKNKNSIVIEVPYGFYFGPPFEYFDDVEFPLKSVQITYSARGTSFKLNLRKNIEFVSKTSTGLFIVKLEIPQKAQKNFDEDLKKQKGKKAHNRVIDVIVIDPGHGGKDPGAVTKRGTREKDIVLSIARKVAKKLRKKGFKVILTRDSDKFITLGQRARIANRSKCDLFISIHANYSKGKRAHGIETYFLSEARTKWERSVAAFENSVIKYELKNKVDEKNILKWILGDMAQNEFLRESQDLAAFVQESMIKKTGELDRGVKQAGFYVLSGVYAPSILIETGFITNPKEEKKLRSKRYQNKIADGIVDGILKYKRYYERKYGKF